MDKKKELMEEKATLLALKWKSKMNHLKSQRTQRAKICFLYYSLHIFKKFVKAKTKKHVPRYMGKTQKLTPEEKYYDDKFKYIPISYLKVKGIKYLTKQINKPIGMIERLPTMPVRDDTNLCKITY